MTQAQHLLRGSQQYPVSRAGGVTTTTRIKPRNKLKQEGEQCKQDCIPCNEPGQHVPTSTSLQACATEKQEACTQHVNHRHGNAQSNTRPWTKPVAETGELATNSHQHPTHPISAPQTYHVPHTATGHQDHLANAAITAHPDKANMHQQSKTDITSHNNGWRALRVGCCFARFTATPACMRHISHAAHRRQTGKRYIATCHEILPYPYS